ncbi:hypothetical protein D9615_003382 [Tricholomella constricta]|uniref:Uncharacterized protein n=1 Tax=Tricholomella constricta TaxID=117010 RepID=A0A8H5HJN0_9AGAR|nr:hypothetical protein D9615_003382 [Tricholomella constricta]
MPPIKTKRQTPTNTQQSTMITRSKARALARESTTVVVSPSATGKGTHTRWQYPEGYVLPTCKPLDTLFSGSLSSPSTSSSSSSISTDTSFDSPTPASIVPETPRRILRPPVTPPRLTPRKLQRSPGGCRWIQENGYTRIILVEDSFTPEAINMRESILQIQLDKIADREMEALMRQRDLIYEAQETWDSENMDCESEQSREGSHGSSSEELSDTYMEESDSGDNGSIETGSGSGYVRGDTEDAEEGDTVSSLPGPSRGLRRLGPTGTELIDPETFTPSFRTGSKSVYPEAWRRALRGQATEQLIR